MPTMEAAHPSLGKHTSTNEIELTKTWNGI
jgi:hypothetical protein